MSTVPTRQNNRFLSSALKPVEVPRCKTYFLAVESALRRMPFAAVDCAADALWHAYLDSRTVYVFGNGGSAALASHCACDLGKGTVVNGNRRFRVIALTDNVPLMTAWANDACYDDIFAEQLSPLIGKSDIALAISGSGNSPNVLKALRVARDAGAFTIGLTGFQGGKMKSLCDLCVVIPSDNMQVIEDLHVSVNHSLFTILRSRISASIEHA
ncbi:MAG TPA: SIS domain-containing protein [Candidatus Sulfotelmatobacter sp.]|nr:SIS domain-containing protein [Candidatus Sulfotelmatobacter sp.]